MDRYCGFQANIRIDRRRFLRARKFDVKAAFKQYSETQIWRAENKIDELYNAIDIDEYEAARHLVSWSDSRNLILSIPCGPADVISGVSRSTSLTLVPLIPLKSPTMSIRSTPGKQSCPAVAELLRGVVGPSTTPVKMLKLFALYEHFTEFVNPWCTAAPSRPFQDTTPITQGCYIVDVANLGLRQAWSLKNHLQDSSTLATNHYPETLGTIFVGHTRCLAYQRLLELRPSSPPYGAGSNDGWTQS